MRQHALVNQQGQQIQRRLLLSLVQLQRRQQLEACFIQAPKVHVHHAQVIADGVAGRIQARGQAQMSQRLVITPLCAGKLAQAMLALSLETGVDQAGVKRLGFRAIKRTQDTRLVQACLGQARRQAFQIGQRCVQAPFISGFLRQIQGQFLLL